jgi:hypothetical protein
MGRKVSVIAELRDALPRGVTYPHVARQFQRGYSILGLARRYRCGHWAIEHAIRAVLKRN